MDHVVVPRKDQELRGSDRAYDEPWRGASLYAPRSPVSILVGQLSSLLAGVGDLAGGDKDSGRVSTCPMGDLRVKGRGLLLALS